MVVHAHHQTDVRSLPQNSIVKTHEDYSCFCDMIHMFVSYIVKTHEDYSYFCDMIHRFVSISVYLSVIFD